MSKRLTDTEKWKDNWFISLDTSDKILWLYALDNCDHAGILEKSFDLMNFCCRTTIKEEGFKDKFKGRIFDCGNFLFIPKFVLFQQKVNSFEELNPLNKCHSSIISILTRKGILSPLKAPKKGLVRGYGIGKGNGIGIGKDNIERFQPIPEETKREIDKLLGRIK